MGRKTHLRIPSLGLIPILVLMLAGCGVLNVVDADVGGRLGFEEGDADDVPEEWSMDSPLHALMLDSEVKHSGRFSGRLKHKDVPKGSAAEEDSAIAKHCSELPQYRGKVVRVSGFLKVEGGAANLVIGGPNYPDSVGVTHVQTADIRGPRDWTEYELFTNNLPGSRNSSEVCFYFELKGAGTVWADDLSIEEVKTEDLSSKVKPIPLPNLDMENRDRRGKLSGWTLEEPKARLEWDAHVKHSGATSAHLAWSEFSSGGDGGGLVPMMARYCTDPGPLMGTVVRVSGWIRSQPPGQGGDLLPHIVMEAYWPDESWSAFVVRSIDATSDWTRHEVLASVPIGSTRVCFGFSGSAMWADDFTAETLAL